MIDGNLIGSKEKKLIVLFCKRREQRFWIYSHFKSTENFAEIESAISQLAH